MLHPEVSSPGETHGTPETVLSRRTQETKHWDRECDQDAMTTWESALAKHLVTRAPWTWEGHKTQAQPSLCLCGVPEKLKLSSLDLASAHNPGHALDSSPAEQPGA